MRRGIAEWVLKRAAGAERGTAAYGDLTEMATTRGRIWFVGEYIRTLIRLGWRTPVAFACGIAAFRLLASLIEFWLKHMPGAWRDHLGPLLVSVGPALAVATATLWVGVPYLMVRYGVRDRMVQLAFVLLVLDTVAFLYIPWLSLACAAAAAIVPVASLCSRTWRKAAIVLVPSVVAGAATFACAAGAVALATQYVLQHIHPGRLIYHSPVLGIAMNAALLSAMLVISWACSRMRRRLLPNGVVTRAADA
jgi:hypothetical protein